MQLQYPDFMPYKHVQIFLRILYDTSGHTVTCNQDTINALALILHQSKTYKNFKAHNDKPQTNKAFAYLFAYCSHS